MVDIKGEDGPARRGTQGPTPNVQEGGKGTGHHRTALPPPTGRRPRGPESCRLPRGAASPATARLCAHRGLPGRLSRPLPSRCLRTQPGSALQTLGEPGVVLGSGPGRHHADVPGRRESDPIGTRGWRGPGARRHVAHRTHSGTCEPDCEHHQVTETTAQPGLWLGPLKVRVVGECATRRPTQLCHRNTPQHGSPRSVSHVPAVPAPRATRGRWHPAPAAAHAQVHTHTHTQRSHRRAGVLRHLCPQVSAAVCGPCGTCDYTTPPTDPGPGPPPRGTECGRECLPEGGGPQEPHTRECRPCPCGPWCPQVLVPGFHPTSQWSAARGH